MAKATSTTRIAGFVVRAAAARRGWRIKDLAAAAGLAPDTVTNCLCGNNTNPTTRLRIEDAIGQAVWTEPDVFAARQHRKQTPTTE